MLTVARSPAGLLLGLGVLAFWLAGPDLASSNGSAGQAEGLSQAEIREAFLEVLNEHRAEEEGPALRLSADLTRIAQRSADTLAAPVIGTAATQLTLEQLADQGYRAKRLVQVLANSLGDVGLVVERWALNNPESYESFLHAEIGDLGVGISQLNHMPLYYLLAAQSLGDHRQRVAASLHELSDVRKELLDQVNIERRRAGLVPFRTHRLLDLTAQRYAEDMLARGFYGHRSPEGRSALDRTKAAGYKSRRVGENLANGAESVNEVMSGWMNSPAHRKNILNRRFQEIGLGLAVGRGAGGFRILWVQCFGGQTG